MRVGSVCNFPIQSNNDVFFLIYFTLFYFYFLHKTQLLSPSLHSRRRQPKEARWKGKARLSAEKKHKIWILPHNAYFSTLFLVWNHFLSSQISIHSLKIRVEQEQLEEKGSNNGKQIKGAKRIKTSTTYLLKFSLCYASENELHKGMYFLV